MNKKLFFTILITLLQVLTNICDAQNIVVKNFEYTPSDATASNVRTLVYDQSGNKCALIKIKTPEKKLTFETTFGIQKVDEKHNGEIWVYLTARSKKITIRHPQYGEIQDYTFPINLKLGHTYSMELGVDQFSEITNPKEGAYLIFYVLPSQSTIYIDEKIYTLKNDGSLSVFLPSGKHYYYIESAGFTSQAGILDINKDKIVKYITLKSVKAILNVKCQNTDAQIFVNDELKGIGECSISLNEGMYVVEARKNGFISQKQTIELEEQEEYTVKFDELIPEYSTLKINTNPPNVDVFLNGKKIGNSSQIFENILAGTYELQLNKQGYKVYKQTITIQPAENMVFDVKLQKGKVGLFSVAKNHQVLFSPGNLQYQASTQIWRFAKNQYDFIGKNNRNISSSYKGWIDLFGWCTSGYKNKWPTMTTSNEYAYGNGQTEVEGTNYDWGIYNSIYNPRTATTDTSSIWRTLTSDEWDYLFNDRKNASAKYARARVNNVNGIILLPDDWIPSDDIPFKNNVSDYTSNVYTDIQWGMMEEKGAVFLPAAGYRNEVAIYNTGKYGFYWSTTGKSTNYAYYLYFTSENLEPQFNYYRHYGFSVRMVSDSVPEIDDDAQIAQNQIDTLANKTLDAVLSNPVQTTFSVSPTTTIHFAPGNLQYKISSRQWRFAEHQYDYIGNENKYIATKNAEFIDLFGWGTSGYKKKSPCMTTDNVYSYGDAEKNIAKTDYDWGVYNDIYNPKTNTIDKSGTWRTLTSDEWRYLFEGRNDANKKYALANVNGVNGLLILPDNCELPDNITFSSGDVDYQNNTYNYTQWTKLEALGVVFLPASGYRDDHFLNMVGAFGGYWSTSSSGGDFAYYIYFYNGYLGYQNDYYRSTGFSVRLVR